MNGNVIHAGPTLHPRAVLRRGCLLIAVMAMLLTGTTEITHLTYYPIPDWICKGIEIIACLPVLLTELRRPQAHIAAALGGMLLFLLGYILFQPYGAGYYLVSFVLYVTQYFVLCTLLQNGHFADLADAFADVAAAVAAVSVFCWLFGSVLGLLPGRTAVVYTFGGLTRKGYTYYYMYFENPAQNQQLLGSVQPRNCGIFCEAPAYSGVLLIALGASLFLRQRPDRLRSVVLVTALLTTQSTKAYIILILLAWAAYFTRPGRTRRNRAFAALISGVLASAAGGAVTYILRDKQNANKSYAARVNHLQAALHTWASRPLFGAGYNNTEAIIQNQTHGAGYGGMSMGLAVMLAQGGLYLMAFYIGAALLPLRNPTVRARGRSYALFVMIAVLNLVVSHTAWQHYYFMLVGAAYAAAALPAWRMPRRNEVWGR